VAKPDRAEPDLDELCHLSRDRYREWCARTRSRRRVSEGFETFSVFHSGEVSNEWLLEQIAQCFVNRTTSVEFCESVLQGAPRGIPGGAQLSAYFRVPATEKVHDQWSAILDPYTLAYLAGHSDFATTRRYVHPNLNTAREALERARVAHGGHKIGHTPAQRTSSESAVIRPIA
jgi:hypothetical protein